VWTPFWQPHASQRLTIPHCGDSAGKNVDSKGECGDVKILYVEPGVNIFLMVWYHDHNKPGEANKKPPERLSLVAMGEELKLSTRELEREIQIFSPVDKTVFGWVTL